MIHTTKPLKSYTTIEIKTFFKTLKKGKILQSGRGVN